MTDIVDTAEPTTLPESRSVSLLRQKIGWLCHLIRWLIVAWLAWSLYNIMSPLIFAGPAAAAVEWGKYWSLADGSITVGEVLINRGLALVSWAAAVVMGVAVWKLMSGYLTGDILSANAAGRLRQVGLTGLVAAAVDIIVRPLMLGVMSSDILKQIPLMDWVEPRDLLYFVIALFVLSLGHIQGTAAIISDEHKQFV
jgi:hypothetical protein